jgi:hypothetical protein
MLEIIEGLVQVDGGGGGFRIAKLYRQSAHFFVSQLHGACVF